METGNKYASLKKILIPIGITVVTLAIIGLFLYILAIPFDIYIIVKDSVTSIL